MSLVVVALALISAGESAPIDRARIRASAGDLVHAGGGAPLGAGRTAFALVLDYAKNPVMFVDRDQGDAKLVAAVADRLVAHLGAAVGLGEILTARLDWSIILAQGRGDAVAGVRLPAIDASAVGDLTLGLALAPFGLDLALTADLVLPTGGGRSYRGETALAVEPGLAGGVSFGPVALGLDLGYRVRERADQLGVIIDDELRGALSMHVAFADFIGLGVSAFGGYTFASELASLELMLGPALRFGGLRLTAMAGAGGGAAPGTPDLRVSLAVGYASRAAR